MTTVSFGGGEERHTKQPDNIVEASINTLSVFSIRISFCLCEVLPPWKNVHFACQASFEDFCPLLHPHETHGSIAC
jgi:hypothetical protein